MSQIYTMKENLDITKIRLSIAELTYDIEETIRLNPEFLLASDSPKKEVIDAFINQMEDVNNSISLLANDESLDQSILFLAVRILELRKKVKEIKNPNLCQDSWTITE